MLTSRMVKILKAVVDEFVETVYNISGSFAEFLNEGFEVFQYKTLVLCIQF